MAELKKKILVCGSVLPRKYEVSVPDLSIAANQYQNNMIHALRSMGEVRVLSYISVDLGTDSASIVSEAAKEGIEVFSGSSKPAVVSRFRRAMRRGLVWADTVITYNVFYPWYRIASCAGRARTRSVLVLADHTPPGESVSLPRKIMAAASQSCIRQYDKVVLLSPGSRQYLSPQQESVVVNGCIDGDKYEAFGEPVSHNPKGRRSMVYSGVLSRVTGVDLLLEAFRLIPDETLELILCGQGEELREVIQSAMQKDPRIRFMGLLPTGDYIRTVMDADVLVNPRNMNYAQNQNNFPSKILEYISSGRPVVSTKFVGYEEYTPYAIFADSTPASIAQGIREALHLDQEAVFARNRDYAASLTWNNNIKKFL